MVKQNWGVKYSDIRFHSPALDRICFFQAVAVDGCGINGEIGPFRKYLGANVFKPVRLFELSCKVEIYLFIVSNTLAVLKAAINGPYFLRYPIKNLANQRLPGF